MAPKGPTSLAHASLSTALWSLSQLPLRQQLGCCRSQTRRFWLPSIPGAASLSPPQTITTRRNLPYSPGKVFALIADIDAYSEFLPYCSTSRVTHWTQVDPASGKRWPARADLTVGWGPFTESYTSRVYCIPGAVVEAVSGKALTTIPGDALARHGREETLDRIAVGEIKGIFESLVTRWTVHSPTGRGEPVGSSPTTQARQQESTDVTLSVRFQFANPALGFAAGNVADEMAEKMVQAFELRARNLYGRKADHS